jgi:hypothetical protein
MDVSSHQNPLFDKKEVGLLSDTPDKVITDDLQIMIETHHTRLIDFAFVASNYSHQSHHYHEHALVIYIL